MTRSFNNYIKNFFEDIQSLKIAIIYLFIAGFWIILSDAILVQLVGYDLTEVVQFQIFKGLFFVVTTAVILYFMVKKYYSKLKAANKELLVNEERYKTFLMSSSEGIYRLEIFRSISNSYKADRIANLIYENSYLAECNDTFAKMYGYENKSELINFSLEKLWRNQKENNLKFLKNFVASEYKISDYETSVMAPDGARKYFLHNLNGIFEGKNIKRIWGVQTDITNLKKTEAALAQSEELYRTVVQNLSEALLITDINDKLLFANKGAVEMFGYDVNELVGNYGYKILLEPDSWHLILEKNKVRFEDRSDIYEVEMKRKDGEKIGVSIHGSPYRDSNGKIIGTIGVITDITERKLARKALEESERNYRSVVNNIREVIYQTDDKGSISFLNPYWSEITGYNTSECLNKSLTDFIMPEDAKKIIDNFIDIVYHGKKFFRVEARCLTKNRSTRWVEVNAKLSFDESGKINGTSGIISDIHDRKLAEEELIKAKEKAEESNKLKSNFLAQISHEVRTPLNIILSYTSIIKDELGCKITPALEEVFQSVENGGKRLLRTIDLILNMSAVQAGSYKVNISKIDISVLLKSLVDEYKNIVNQKNLTLKFNLIDDPCIVLGDEYTLSQAFHNIVDNAIKFTEKGEIKVSLSRIYDGRIEVEISDTGIGISPSYLPRLFEPFSQEENGYSRKYEGNGLGLALTKKYIELNKALISVESIKGKGTTFKVYLNKAEN
jgi:PAS domain S-box-containing protein